MMKPNTIEFYEWDDFQLAICEEMGIDDKDFRDYHRVVHPDIESFSGPDTPYYDCWHVWISVFDKHLENDSYSSIWFQTPDKPGDKDGEWVYIEENAVKEYGEWARTFVKAVCRVVAKYKLANKETLIHYSW